MSRKTSLPKEEDYNKKINSGITRHHRMADRILEMIHELNLISKQDLILTRSDMLEEFGKELSKGWKYWDSIKNPDKY